MFRFVFDKSWYEARWLTVPAPRRPGLLARTAERLISGSERTADDTSWRIASF